MRRTLVYIIPLLIIAVAVYILKKPKQAPTASDQDFAVEDISQINRIVITDKAGTKADLHFLGNQWEVNNKYKVLQPAMDVLLETIRRVRVYAPVSKSAWNNVIKEMSVKANKVELYRKGEDKPFKIYYVGGSTSDSKGTYMLMEINGKPAAKPYIVHLPGFEGLLDVRYFTDEVKWRDTGIFNYDMENIAQVSVTYAAYPEYSFAIKNLGSDSFEVIRPKTSGLPPSGSALNKNAVVKYLSSFTFLNAEAYDNTNPKKDSVVASTPFVIVTVTDLTARSKQMVVYHMPVNRRSKLQFDAQGNKLPFDIDRYYAVINEGKDFVIIQEFVFGKIFKRYEDFFFKQT